MSFSQFIGRNVEVETRGGRRVRGRIVIIRGGVIVIIVRRRRRRRSFIFLRTVQISRVVVIGR